MFVRSLVHIVTQLQIFILRMLGEGWCLMKQYFKTVSTGKYLLRLEPLMAYNHPSHMHFTRLLVGQV